MSPHSTPQQAEAADYGFAMLVELAAIFENNANEPAMAALLRGILDARRQHVAKFAPLVAGLNPPPGRDWAPSDGSIAA